MMINELPKTTATIATTYFENVDDQSQFRKEMDYNMKLLSGLDPAITNQEIYEMNRQQDDKEIYGGTEQAIIDTEDPEIRGLMANRIETFAAARRSNPDLALQDFYTSTEEANRIVTDDVYRINYTNSKDDPHMYDTKYTIGMQKMAEAMDNIEPDYARLAFRYVGQPALSIGATYLGGAYGAGISDALIAGWDSLVLGGTIYNIQEKFVNRWHELLDDKSLTQEQFAQGVDNLVAGIQKLDPAYQQEIFSAISQGPNPYADGGLTFTTFGLKTYAKPFGALARSVMKPIGFIGKSSLLKKMQMNQELVSKIEKSMSNKVDEAVVDEAIATKVATTAPADADAKTVETVKGIEKNKEVDAKILQNSSNDKSFFNSLLEGLAGTNEKTGSNQRGEIKIGKEPEQSYFIDHGKGIDNLPMTYEEAVKWMKNEQGRNHPVLYHNTEFGEIPFEPDKVPDYINITTASAERWEDLRFNYDKKAGSGEGGQAHGGGGYGSIPDNNFEASREGYRYDFTDYINPSTKIKDKIKELSIDDNLVKKGFFEFDKDEKFYKDYVDDIKNERLKKEYFEALTKLGYFKEKTHPEDFKKLRQIMNTLNISDRDIFYGVIGKVGYDTDQAVSKFISGKFKYDLPSLEWSEGYIKTFAYDEIEDLLEAYKNLRKKYNLSDDEFKKAVERLDSPGGNEELLDDIEKMSEYISAAVNRVSDKRQFNTFIKNLKNNNIDVVTFAPLYSHPIKNWEKYPELYLYHDDARGVFPMSYFFSGNGIEKRAKITEKAMDNIENDIINSIKKDYMKFFSNRTDISPAEVAEDLIKAIKKGQFRSNWKGWENLQKEYLYNALPDNEKPKYFRDWQSKYYTSKGIMGTVHFGGGSPGENIVIHDRNAFKKITKEEFNVGPDEFQIGYDNAHMIVSAGDGVGYFGRELHGVKDAKPMIIKAGKTVDFGNYKPYNSEK